MNVLNKNRTRTAYFLAGVFLLTGLFSGWKMYALNESQLLWGHWPLVHTAGLWMGLALLITARRIRDNYHLQLLGLSTLTALLLSYGFPPYMTTPLMFVGFVPFFLLLDKIKKHQTRRKYRTVFFYAFHTFILWNILTTFWICNTAYAAGLVAFTLNAFFMAIMICVYYFIKKRIRASYHFLAFASTWISFEFLHHHWELQWPWLTLGNALARWPFAAQWYEYTGVFGGTLWILAINWLISRYFIQNIGKKQYNLLYRAALLFLLPLAVSVLMYVTHRPPENEPVEVAVIQPNFEPHYEKFDIPQSEQINRFIELSAAVLTPETDFLVFPETSFDVLLNNWKLNTAVRRLKGFLGDYPNTALITGTDSRRIYNKGDQHTPFTRTYVRGARDTVYWENHNSAIYFKGDDYEIYYKSKLVPGPEFFPFRRILFFLSPLVKKLGGSFYGLRMQPERSVFDVPDKSAVAPVICYESVFGEYVSGYTDAGAEMLFIMTNDGWWDRTAGHRQHLYFASLRAIEQRKPIARSANTGISCFINDRGDIRMRTNYDEATAIVDQVIPNDKVTLYAKRGDIIARIAVLIFFGMLIFSIARREKVRTGE